MSRLLRDHKRLMSEAVGAARGAGKRRQEEHDLKMSRAHYNSGPPVTERTRFDFEKRKYEDERSDAVRDRLSKSYAHQHDESWLRASASGRADPRAVLARTEHGKDALSQMTAATPGMMIPGMTYGAGGRAGGGGAAGGGAGDPSYKNISDVADGRRAYWSDPMNERFLPTHDTHGDPLKSREEQLRYAVEQDLRHHQSVVGAHMPQPAGPGQYTSPQEWDAARRSMRRDGSDMAGISIGRGADGHIRATDNIDTAVGKAIQSAFADLSKSGTEEAIKGMPEGHRDMARQTAQHVQKDAAWRKPYGGYDHPVHDKNVAKKERPAPTTETPVATPTPRSQNPRGRPEADQVDKDFNEKYGFPMPEKQLGEEMWNRIYKWWDVEKSTGKERMEQEKITRFFKSLPGAKRAEFEGEVHRLARKEGINMKEAANRLAKEWRKKL